VGVVSPDHQVGGGDGQESGQRHEKKCQQQAFRWVVIVENTVLCCPQTEMVALLMLHVALMRPPEGHGDWLLTAWRVTQH